KHHGHAAPHQGLPAGGGDAAPTDIHHGTIAQQPPQKGQQKEQDRIGLPGPGNVQPQQGQTHAGHTTPGTLQPSDGVEGTGNGQVGQVDPQGIPSPHRYHQQQPSEQAAQSLSRGHGQKLGVYLFS